MRLTISLARPESRRLPDTNDAPPQDINASDRGSIDRPRKRAAPVVMRVLHQGEELPKEKSLQWLVSELMCKDALHQGDKPSRDDYGDEITERQSSSSTLTLHVECEESGEWEQAIQASGSANVVEHTLRSPSSAPSQPLSAVARHYANLYFDYYWRRTPDGAPCRYTDADCWHPGVQAAVVSTVTQLRQEGTYVDAAPVLAFMQDKAVRQFGEVKNGHKFKRPPSTKCMARYRAIAAAWLQNYHQHQILDTVPADMHAILCSSRQLQGSWKMDTALYHPPRSQAAHFSATMPESDVTASEALAVEHNPFLTEQDQGSEGLIGGPEDFQLLSSNEASDELDDAWLSSMVAELLTPEEKPTTTINGTQGATVPDPDSMSRYEPHFLQQPCQSNKRKRCFLAAA